VLAWAGAVGEDIAVESSILHLAPVVRETPGRWRGRADFVGLTPQGLLRRWEEPAGEIVASSPEPQRIPAHCDAVVLSEQERVGCTGLIAAARSAGGVVAITAGPSPTTLMLADGRALAVPVPSVREPLDDVGAGDVFAAAFFVALREGRAPRRAAEFANAAATLRIEGTGAQAIAGRATIEARRKGVV